MLIETPAKLSDVVTVKLIGGDEVLGRLTDENANTIELNKPLLVAMGPQGFGLMPFVLTAGADAKIRIDRTHIIVMVKTIDQVAKEYTKQTSNLIM